jgi:trk system potassium uptake protein TrkH
MMYLLLFFGSGLIISRIEGLPLMSCLFETASAIGTVGLTLGITSHVSVASRLILIVLMFLGRVGGLTLIYAAQSVKKGTQSTLPLEKITVG